VGASVHDITYFIIVTVWCIVYLFFVNINLFKYCSCNYIYTVFIVCSVSFIVCVVLYDVCYLCVASYCSTTATG
jgi:hypothetical protein